MVLQNDAYYSRILDAFGRTLLKFCEARIEAISKIQSMKENLIKFTPTESLWKVGCLISCHVRSLSKNSEWSSDTALNALVERFRLTRAGYGSASSGKTYRCSLIKTLPLATSVSDFTLIGRRPLIVGRHSWRFRTIFGSCELVYEFAENVRLCWLLCVFSTI